MGNRLQDLFGVSDIKPQSLVSSPPKTLADMVATGSATTGVLEVFSDLQRRVRFRVDYSDFANFVFFNSALDYFNISGERVLNEFPHDGTYEDQARFLSQSDGYQAYLLEQWPRFSGSAHFGPAVALSGTIVYASAPDNGVVSGSAVGGLLALGTSSWTYEQHLRIAGLPTGSNERAVVFQVVPSGSTTGSVTVSYDQSGTFYLDVVDASGTASSAAVPLATGSRYMGWVLSRESAASLSWSLYVTDPATGTGYYQSQRPYEVASGSIAVGSFPVGPSVFSVGSGSLPSSSATVCPDFYIGELRVWNSALTSAEIFANYNTRVFKEDGLQLYWRFDDHVSSSQANSIVRVIDRSGHRISSSVYNVSSTGSSFYTQMPSGVFGDGGNGMSPQDTGELRLDWRDLVVQQFVQEIQTSASAYDRDNTNIITNLVPQSFLQLEDERNTRVMRDLLYVLARQFDELKVAIDNVPRALLPSYTGFDDSPDALLEEALRFWGWDPRGSFLSKEAFQYLFGYSVVSGEQALFDNQRLDTTLAGIKNEFWRRTLQNLLYIYKRKGTREAIDALLRVYGLDEKVVKVKEFGVQPNVFIQTRRINSDKSTTALQMTGALTVETRGQAIPLSGNFWTNFLHIRFPAPGDTVMPPTLLTGSIEFASQVSGGLDALAHSLAMPLGPLTSGSSSTFFVEELRYGRPAPGTTDPITGQLIDTTGSLMYFTSDGSGTVTSGTFSGVPIFDGRWYTLAQHRIPLSVSQSAYEIHILHLDEDIATEVYHVEITSSLTSAVSGAGYDFGLGRNIVTFPAWQTTSGSEFWVRNVQVWNIHHTDTELLDHALNPFSHGADTPARALSMSLQWELDQEKDAQVSGGVYDSAFGAEGALNITGSFFIGGTPVSSSAVTYLRDVFDYNFIAPPEHSWNEEKIRSLDAVRVAPEDQWHDSGALSLEFNLIDALNEDISLMMSSLDNWNNVIGAAANRYRDTYPTLDRLRQQYFGRLSGRINFRAFADFLDFFDRSFVDLVRRLVPARANFKGAEFVVESHMLERPKAQITYRRFSPMLVPEGRIVISTPYPNLLPNSGSFVSPGNSPFLFDSEPTDGLLGSLAGFGDIDDPAIGGILG